MSGDNQTTIADENMAKGPAIVTFGDTSTEHIGNTELAVTSDKDSQTETKSIPKRLATKGSFKKGDKRICRDGAQKRRGLIVNKLIRDLLESVPRGKTKSEIETIIRNMIRVSRNPDKMDIKIIQLLMDRAYGKVENQIKLSGEVNISIARLIASGVESEDSSDSDTNKETE